MIKAESSPLNSQRSRQSEQEFHPAASDNLGKSTLLYSQLGSPLNLRGKFEFLASEPNSNIDLALLGNKPTDFGRYTCSTKSEADFDLDREPYWAFEGESLSYFTDKPKPLKVLVVTWNLNGKKPGEVLEQLLNTRKTNHHIIAIATQECLKSIGMSFLDNNKDEWVQMLKGFLGDRFQLVKDHTMNAIHLAVFARKEVNMFIRDLESSQVATGFANFLGNKGAVAISFKVLGNSFLFLSCHLSCGQSETERRNQDLDRILQNMPLPWHRLEQEYISESEKSLFSHYDFVFVAGDLNYRVDLDPEETVKQFEEKKYEFLLEKDQLNLRKASNQDLFQQLQEGEIRFAPTYKFELTTQSLDSSKERRPAWTDRILYTCNTKDVKVEQKSYDSIRKVFGSDHRPVFSQFLLTLDLSQQKKVKASKEPPVNSSLFCGL